jgi:hypothetical protein
VSLKRSCTLHRSARHGFIHAYMYLALVRPRPRDAVGARVRNDAEQQQGSIVGGSVKDRSRPAAPLHRPGRSPPAAPLLRVMTPETQPDCDARGRGVLVTVVVVVVVVSINFYWLWGAVWCGWCRTGRERGNSQDSWSCRAGISTERSNKLRPCMKQQPFSFDARPASSSMRVHAARAKYGSDCSSGLGFSVQLRVAVIRAAGGPSGRVGSVARSIRRH